jgi:hypothetical protein
MASPEKLNIIIRSVFDGIATQTDIGRHIERSRNVTIKIVNVKSIAILKQPAVADKMMID